MARSDKNCSADTTQTCPICLDALGAGHEPARVADLLPANHPEAETKTRLPCQHRFCTSCIVEWARNVLEVAAFREDAVSLNATCPICKDKFDVQETFDIDREKACEVGRRRRAVDPDRCCGICAQILGGEDQSALVDACEHAFCRDCLAAEVVQQRLFAVQMNCTIQGGAFCPICQAGFAFHRDRYHQPAQQVAYRHQHRAAGQIAPPVGSPASAHVALNVGDRNQPPQQQPPQPQPQPQPQQPPSRTPWPGRTEGDLVGPFQRGGGSTPRRYSPHPVPPPASPARRRRRRPSEVFSRAGQAALSRQRQAERLEIVDTEERAAVGRSPTMLPSQQRDAARLAQDILGPNTIVQIQDTVFPPVPSRQPRQSTSTTTTTTTTTTASQRATEKIPCAFCDRTLQRRSMARHLKRIHGCTVPQETTRQASVQNTNTPSSSSRKKRKRSSRTAPGSKRVRR